ncbi:hypothetical protein SAMN04490248_10482 [Salinihabitans flavidus]|uniref:O-antigen ligase like membrane protein n=1 Tax=Salinihabitans flavidus TaxID=569882 RepID=A0A1H8P0A3_9RHOB|nr:hypothetical protein [Salinihabitans flavidus]SEO35181.1 hypothetical protein SAMN04490248_10482 [Salinihabitans flavidus]
MPNLFAQFVIAIWPFVAYALFRSLPMGRALIWATLIAFLLLPPRPAGFDFPLMPPLNKETLPNLSILLVAFLFLGKRLSLMPRSLTGRGLALLFVLSPIATVAVNGESLNYGLETIRGLGVRDALALTITQGIFLIPFLLACRFLRDEAAQRDLLLALVIGGLAYSLPILLEVRISPQLNIWIYGFFQHMFEQSIRGDGYRPIVFLYHGIWVAFFVMCSFAAALALGQTADGMSRLKYLLVALWLAIVLVLCKTLGPLIYAVFFGAAVMFLTRRMMIRLAVVLAVIALTYPVLKGADLVPTQAILSQAEKVSAERANSLRFRFDNEDMLLERARQKPLFGWGSWGRNHMRNPVDGTIETVADGRWVITFGVYGWTGYVAEFGLLALPIFLLFREVGRLDRGRVPPVRRRPRLQIPVVLRRRGPDADRLRPSPYIGPLALLLGVNMMELLPNATLTPITWLISGALLGHAELLAEHRSAAHEARDGAIGRAEPDVPKALPAQSAPKRRRSVL